MNMNSNTGERANERSAMVVGVITLPLQEGGAGERAKREGEGESFGRLRT